MTKRSVADFFNTYAEKFDTLGGGRAPFHSSLFNRIFRRSMQLRFDKTLTACMPLEGRTVLDIGCGPGHYSIALARLGAGKVVGLDFAENMLSLAARHAAEAGVTPRCEFLKADFMEYPISEPFDYAVAMGFMDYISQPEPMVARILSVTHRKALFSFPSDCGFLAWQRKLRYRHRCDLFMYQRDQIERLFSTQTRARIEIEDLGRDFFVTAHIRTP